MYIGDKKIAAESAVPGKDRTLVKFEDGTEKEFPQALLASARTEQPTDATTLRDLMVKPLLLEILALMLKYGFRVEWLDYLLSSLKKSVSFSLEEAEGKLWKKPVYEVTFEDIDRVLTQKS